MRNTLGWLWIALLGIAGAIKSGLSGRQGTTGGGRA